MMNSDDRSRTTIYYNEECSKCREALCILGEHGERPRVVEYLKQTPSEEELAALVKMLGIPASELVRRSEPLFEEKFAGRELTDAEWIAVMVANPVLIQRPIVVKDGKAMIGRPPRLIESIL